MKFAVSLSMERFSPEASMTEARDRLLALARVAAITALLVSPPKPCR